MTSNRLIKKVFLLFLPFLSSFSAQAVVFKVFDIDTQEPLMAKVLIKAPETGKILDSGTADPNGFYYYSEFLEKATVEVSIVGYLHEKIEMQNKKRKDTVSVGLKIIMVICTVPMPEIHFSLNSYTVDSSQIKTLDKLIAISKNHPTLRMHIIGCAEKEEFLKDHQLPGKRAKAGHDYLTKNSGIGFEIGEGDQFNTSENIHLTGRKVIFRILDTDEETITIEPHPGNGNE